MRSIKVGPYRRQRLCHVAGDALLPAFGD